MGKIFPFNEILSRHVPRVEDFKIMKRMIIREMESCEGIVAALIYGSILTENHTRRSDIDFLYIYKKSLQECVSSTLYKIQREADKRHIPLQFAPFEEQIARTPFHYIDLQFASNLQLIGCSKGGVIKQNPFEILCFEKEERHISARNYFRNKMRRLEKLLERVHFLKEPEIYDQLSKALQTAIHTCRVMLYLYDCESKADTRLDIIQKYEAIILRDTQNGELLSKKLHIILQLDAHYSAELQAQLDRPDEKRYAQVIKEIKLGVPMVLDFIHSNSLFISRNYKAPFS